MEPIFYTNNNNIYNISPELKKTIKSTIYNRKKFANEILNFIEILEKEDDINLNIFYRNLLGLKILNGDSYFENNRIKELLTGKIELGHHKIIANQIVIRDNYIDKTLNHELLHVASSIYSKHDEVIYSGFFQVSNKLSIYIGRALNEGYTELLHQRHFPNNFNCCYEKEVKIASLIEELVGKKKMYESYFNANLPKLIEALTNLDSEENIITFLCEESRNYPNKCIKNFIKYNYLNKMINDYYNKTINEEQLINKIAKCYHFIGEKKIDNIIKYIFNSKEINNEINYKIKTLKIEENNKFKEENI